MDNVDKYFEDRGGLLPESLPEELTPLSKTPTEGLTITRIFPGSVPVSAELSNQIVELAPLLGWTGKALAYDGSVEDLNRKAMDAIGNSDVVVVDGPPPAAVQAPIQAAKDNGVLFMIGSITDPPQSVPGFGGSPLGGDFYVEVGEVGAYSFMKATNCKGKMAAFGLAGPGSEPLSAQAEVVKKTLEENCEDCEYAGYTGVGFSDIGSPAATNAVVSKLQSDPSIDFAYFTIGDLATGIEPALKQAGIDAKIGGAIASPTNLSQLKKGENSFWLGIPPTMSALINLDTAARALDSGKPTVGQYYPVPVFTADNVESTDPIPTYPQDYEDQFKEIWQVG